MILYILMTGEMPWSSLVSLEEPQLSEVHDRAVTACCCADMRGVAIENPTCNGELTASYSMARAVVFQSVIFWYSIWVAPVPGLWCFEGLAVTLGRMRHQDGLVGSPSATQMYRALKAGCFPPVRVFFVKFLSHEPCSGRNP